MSIVCVGLILVATICIYNAIYVPTKSKIDGVNLEINLIKEELKKKGVETEGNIESADIANEDKESKKVEIEFIKYPVDLREQDQIDYFLKLMKDNYIQLSSLTMTNESKLGDINEGELMKRTMSFKYEINSYDEFRGFFESAKCTPEYPSSVEIFSMNIDEQGKVSGDMTLNNYYIITDLKEREYKKNESISIGTERIFRHE